jgi:peptide/nickel transport system permease protein
LTDPRPKLPATAEPPDAEFAPYDPMGRYRRVLARLRPNLSFWSGVLVLSAFGVLALYAELAFGSGLGVLVPTPNWSLQVVPFSGPTAGHWFGIDSWLGVDVFQALLQATPFDLGLVGGILLGAALLGIVLGAVGGLLGGIVDLLVVGASDLLSGVPPFFFVVVLFLGVKPLLTSGSDPLPVFGLLFVLVLWPYYARPVRSLAQRAATAPYAESARASGAGSGRLLTRHVLPNSLSPVFAQLPVDVYNIFFVLTVFPFLGCFTGGSPFAPISVTPSVTFPEWGSLLGYGACYGWSLIPSLDAWWSYTFPALFIVLFGFGVMLLCDGLERHLSSAPVV